MSKVRHWKQHWDPDAAFVFAKRRKLGVAGIEYVNPGDDVTPEIRAELGPKADYRLRQWWEAKFIELKDWEAPEVMRAERRGQSPEELSTVRPKPEPTGKGWYVVRSPEGEFVKVRGLANALRRIDDLWQPVGESASS